MAHQALQFLKQLHGAHENMLLVTGKADLGFTEKRDRPTSKQKVKKVKQKHSFHLVKFKTTPLSLFKYVDSDDKNITGFLNYLNT